MTVIYDNTVDEKRALTEFVIENGPTVVDGGYIHDEVTRLTAKAYREAMFTLKCVPAENGVIGFRECFHEDGSRAYVFDTGSSVYQLIDTLMRNGINTFIYVDDEERLILEYENLKGTKYHCILQAAPTNRLNARQQLEFAEPTAADDYRNVIELFYQKTYKFEDINKLFNM